MRVRYTRPALAELDAVLTFIADHSPGGARRVHSAIKAIEAILADHPLAGRTTRLPWLRRIKASGYPYLVFYEVTANDIVIHAVRHASRRPSSMPDAD